MDSLTHIVLGACAGEVLAGKKLGKKAMLLGAIANSLPDMDVITSFWMSQPDGLLAHRGFTHSILFVLLMIPVAGWCMKKIIPQKNFSQQEWSLLFGVNMFLHILVDSFTAYGTGWFEPFSHHRISFNILFVADPFYTIALFISFIALLILKRTSPRRMKWAKAGLLISSIYVVYALYHKLKVDEVSRNSFSDTKKSELNFLATPTPFNNFLWYIVAMNDSGFDIGYYSVFDKSEKIDFHFIPKNDSLLRIVKSDDDVKKLIRFSQGFYHVEKVKDTLVFMDLRFGQIGGWENGDAPFVFQYKLTRDANNDVMIQRGRMKASAGEALKSMIKRIQGK